MFRWYKDATKCYVYLSDIVNKEFDGQTFRNSRWFTRGWTLQELLVPNVVKFFSAYGDYIGDKGSLLREITNITSIPPATLEGSPSSQFSVRERMSWAKGRMTKRDEDAAYCLLGLFDVSMPLLYGEGRDKAFSRLWNEIHASLFNTQRDAESLMGLLEWPENKSKSSLAIPEGDTTGVKALFGGSIHAYGHDFPSNALHIPGNAGKLIRGSPEGLQDYESTHTYQSTASISGTGFQELTHQSSLLEDQTYVSNLTSTLLNLGIAKEESSTRAKDLYQFLLDLNFITKLKSQEAINEWLDMTGFNDRHSVAQYHDKQTTVRLEGTCDWIVSHAAYRDWISDSDSNSPAKILWVNAPAGCGKTVLCARLVDHFKTMHSSHVSYFFASPHASSGGDLSYIIRSRISQIVRLDTEALSLIRRHSELGERASTSSVWSVFKAMVSIDRRYIFVLDGLDEYGRVEHDRSGFLRNLKTAIAHTASRVLITSRSETDIQEEFTLETAGISGLVLLHFRISNQDVKGDVSLVSRFAVDKKLPNKDEKLREELAFKISEKCQGMFLWVKIQQDRLRGGKNARQLQHIVQNMPEGLGKSYERNWRVIGSQNAEDQNRALAIFEWTTFAFRPLTVCEIAAVLMVRVEDNAINHEMGDLPDNIDEDYINSEIVGICGSLVEARIQDGDWIGHRTIHLIHPSVREFLLHGSMPNLMLPVRRPSQPNMILEPSEVHAYLATICLGIVNYDDSWLEQSMPEGSVLACIDYALTHLMAHVRAAGDGNEQLSRLLKDFLQINNENFQRWSRRAEGIETDITDPSTARQTVGTPLYYAALHNLPVIVSANDKTQLDKVGGEFGTPLQAACWKGHEMVFRMLLYFGAYPNVIGGECGVPINAAIARGHNSLVNALLALNVDLTLRDPRGKTPLYTAALYGNSEALHHLVELGAGQCDMYDNDWTPINAAAAEEHIEAVKLLIAGSQLETPNSNGYTPLLSAIGENQTEIVEILLQHNARLSGMDNNGWSPINLAAHRGNVQIVQLLLEHGADIETPIVGSSWTALNLAVGMCHFDLVRCLLERGANIATVDDKGFTPINSACCSGSVDIFNLLLAHGADIATSSKEGWTPLISAADEGHTEIMKLLLEMGGDIFTCNDGGWTALNSAACAGHIEAVKLLIEHGADIEVANHDGWTPLNTAAN